MKYILPSRYSQLLFLLDVTSVIFCGRFLVSLPRMMLSYAAAENCVTGRHMENIRVKSTLIKCSHAVLRIISPTTARRRRFRSWLWDTGRGFFPGSPE